MPRQQGCSPRGGVRAQWMPCARALPRRPVAPVKDTTLPGRAAGERGVFLRLAREVEEAAVSDLVDSQGIGFSFLVKLSMPRVGGFRTGDA